MLDIRAMGELYELSIGIPFGMFFGTMLTLIHPLLGFPSSVAVATVMAALYPLQKRIFQTVMEKVEKEYFEDNFLEPKIPILEEDEK